TVRQLPEGVGCVLGRVDDRTHVAASPIFLAHQCPGADCSLPSPSGTCKEGAAGHHSPGAGQYGSSGGHQQERQLLLSAAHQDSPRTVVMVLGSGISVRAQHIPGHTNTSADQASRRVMDASSWKLCPQIFHRINCRWGPIHTDLFADFSNYQVRHYYSWKPDPLAAAVDALSQDWTGQGLYAFPPFSLVSRCIAKLQTSKSPLILVAPVWPSQPWYASLLHHSYEEPRLIPHSHHLLCSHDGQAHPMLNSGSLALAVWRLSSSS
ncbi:unnamed protein product, partial [Ixodes hexagonus]